MFSWYFSRTCLALYSQSWNDCTSLHCSQATFGKWRRSICQILIIYYSLRSPLAIKCYMRCERYFTLAYLDVAGSFTILHHQRICHQIIQFNLFMIPISLIFLVLISAANSQELCNQTEDVCPLYAQCIWSEDGGKCEELNCSSYLQAECEGISKCYYDNFLRQCRAVECVKMKQEEECESFKFCQWNKYSCSTRQICEEIFALSNCEELGYCMYDTVSTLCKGYKACSTFGDELSCDTFHHCSWDSGQASCVYKACSVDGGCAQTKCMLEEDKCVINQCKQLSLSLCQDPACSWHREKKVCDFSDCEAQMSSFDCINYTHCRWKSYLEEPSKCLPWHYCSYINSMHECNEDRECTYSVSNSCDEIECELYGQDKNTCHQFSKCSMNTQLKKCGVPDCANQCENWMKCVRTSPDLCVFDQCSEISRNTCHQSKQGDSACSWNRSTNQCTDSQCPSRNKQDCSHLEKCMWDYYRNACFDLHCRQFASFDECFSLNGCYIINQACLPLAFQCHQLEITPDHQCDPNDYICRRNCDFYFQCYSQQGKCLSNDCYDIQYDHPQCNTQTKCTQLLSHTLQKYICANYECSYMIKKQDCHSYADCLWYTLNLKPKCIPRDCSQLSSEQCSLFLKCQLSSDGSSCEALDCWKLDQADCRNQLKCNWNTAARYCYILDCSLYYQDNCDQFEKCFWNYALGQCLHYQSCESIASRIECSQTLKCTFLLSDYTCSAKSCNESDNEQDCIQYSQCQWENSSCNLVNCYEIYNVSKEQYYQPNQSECDTKLGNHCLYQQQQCQIENCNYYLDRYSCNKSDLCQWNFNFSFCQDLNCKGFDRFDCEFLQKCQYGDDGCEIINCIFQNDQESCDKQHDCTWDKLKSKCYVQDCFSYPLSLCDGFSKCTQNYDRNVCSDINCEYISDFKRCNMNVKCSYDFDSDSCINQQECTDGKCDQNSKCDDTCRRVNCFGIQESQDCEGRCIWNDSSLSCEYLECSQVYLEKTLCDKSEYCSWNVGEEMGMCMNMNCRSGENEVECEKITKCKWNGEGCVMDREYIDLIFGNKVEVEEEEQEEIEEESEEEESEVQEEYTYEPQSAPDVISSTKEENKKWEGMVENIWVIILILMIQW